MRKVWFAVLLLSGAFLLAQDNNSGNTAQQDSKDSKGEVTLRGCVSRASGDYTLMKENPAITYELQGTHGIKLRHYLGKRVEVTGTVSPTLATSSDATARLGTPAPETITANSIKILDKVCSAPDVER